jgi:biotin transport system ATP-binding protein
MIKLSDVSYQYDGQDKAVLDKVNLEIHEGEYVALVGPNGCGKTTLIRQLNALLLPVQGMVSIDGLDTRDPDKRKAIRRLVGMIFQSPDSQIVGMTVEEDVAFGPGNLGLPPAEIRRRVDEVLGRLDLQALAGRAPYTLSGGEKRLVSLAGVLIMNPRYIAFDEPTAYLDPAGRQRVLEMMGQLHGQGIGVIHITHDINDMVDADRLVVMDRGRIVLDGSPREIFTRLMQDGNLALPLPPVMELIHHLRSKGWHLPAGILSVSEASREIHHCLLGGVGTERMIRFGQFIGGHSFGHRLDARVKIVSTILLSALIFQARGREILLITAFLAAVCFISRLQVRLVLNALRPLGFFSALLFALHLFSTEGAALLTIPILKVQVTQEGFSRGFLVSWQFLALAFSGAILTMTTSPSDLVHGLENLMAPLRYVRVPVQDIAVMVSMALRFVPTFLEEFDRIREAQAARGADVHTGRLSRRVKAMAALVVPLMVSTFRRADELTDAMEARGYARGMRTTLNTLHFGLPEAAVLIAMILFLSLTIVSGTIF